MRCINRLITLLVSAATTLAGACLSVPGAEAHAEELAAVIPAFSRLEPGLALFAIPGGGLSRVVRRAEMQAWLGDSSEALAIPDRICVERLRVPIPEAVWKIAAEQALLAFCPGVPHRLRLVHWPAQPLPRGELTFQASDLRPAGGGPANWRGALRLPEGKRIPVWIQLDLQFERESPVLARSVPARAVLQREDVRMKTNWARGGCPQAGDLTGFVGMEATRPMAEGTALTPRDVKSVPAVRRGQEVQMVAVSGATVLQFTVIAERDAAVGDVVPVRSRWNGSKLTGTVLSPGSVLAKE